MTSALKTAFQSLKKGVSSLTSGYPTLQLSFHPESRLKLIEIPCSDDESQEEFIPVYSDGSNISGHLDIILPDNIIQFEYEEIAVYLVGHVLCEDIDQDQVFLSHKITLNRSGTLSKNTEFDFKFAHPSLSMDSFYGSLFKCRYFIRAIINRSKVFQSNIKLDQDFMVMNIEKLRESKKVTMQVGVDECLHIRFEYDNINLSTHGCLEGRVTILSNTLKITTMQIQLIRREMIRTVDAHKPEIINTLVLGKYEIMDGFPGDNEEIPIRMFIQRFKGISNTQINEHFSVRYYVNLGLIDMDGRRYFKTCELNLFRTKLL